MSRLRVYQVDAFTGKVFAGNPAAVVPLLSWLDDELMQAIAAENNLSETAFFVPSHAGYELRWFTPKVEVKLCGHATLAAAFVLFTELELQQPEVRFETLSGELVVSRRHDSLAMNFPTWPLQRLEVLPAALLDSLNVTPAEVWMTASEDNLFAVFRSEAEVRALAPDMRRLAALHPAGVVATAAGSGSVDCVCRYFAPSYGVDEDPGTGSIHCGLVPYWAARLGKNAIHSRQVSARGAELFCELQGSRTIIAGQAVKYLEGWIHI
jgi:PhzF family phenazine biosynthesis protein